LKSKTKYIPAAFGVCFLLATTSIDPACVGTLLRADDSSDCVTCHGVQEGTRLRNEAGGYYLMGKGDRGVGVVDKGDIQNVHGNFGLISDFHFFAPALQWPGNSEDFQQYGFGVLFFVAIDGNVITSYADPTTQVETFDWEARDGSRGDLYSSTRTDNNTASDGTPFLAHSDIRDTWPGYPGDPYWPGLFRINIDSTSATYGEEVEGEFTSDRDIYCIFDDEDNMNTPLGISVTQTTYAYGRPYAEDFFFLNYWIKNASGQLEGTTATDYDSIYVGIFTDIKNDFNNDDLIGMANIGGSVSPSGVNFIHEWDSNDIPENTQGVLFDDWVGEPDAMVGHSGIGVVLSPDNAGITDFHYFDDAYTPLRDEEFWPVISSNPDDPAIDPSLYFHGPNPRIDHDSLSGAFLDPDPNDDRDGADITFIISTGPFDLNAGDSVNYAVVVVMGKDSTDLFANAEEAFTMAQDLYFQGSNPPATPIVSGLPGDRKATIFWNADPSESSRDIRTSEQDFEGYRVYKSTDRGRTWGDPITDQFGDLVAYVPIAQYDLADSIMGFDPVNGRYLGNDSGISRSFVDTDVLNGYEYWYCVTAYDQGVPEQNEPSYENGIGRSTVESHVVSITPGVDPSNMIPGSGPEGDLEPIGGACQGTIQIHVFDPSALTGHEYEIAFNDTFEVINDDTTFLTTLNLYDITDGTYRFTDDNTGEEFTFRNFVPDGDNLPVVDGFRVYAKDVEGEGVSFRGWTVINGDSCTYDWWTENRTGNVSELPEVILSADDWKIVITEPESTISVAITDGPAWSDPPYIAEYNDVPFRIYKITDPENPVDVSEFIQVMDLRVVFPESELLGPLGYDLIPGGKGYNPIAGDMWPDNVRIRDNNESWVNEVWLRTQNGPADATPPSPGDEYTLRTFKPFRQGITFQFQTAGSEQTAASSADLDAIKVVPNPYIVTAGWEVDRFNRRLQFNHLPDRCTIDIYTLAGDHVVTIHHEDDSGDEFWDLTNKNGQNIAYGLYIYVVETPNGKKRIGKFLVIK
jgi:hypothetical protein